MAVQNAPALGLARLTRSLAQAIRACILIANFRPYIHTGLFAGQ